MGTSGLRSYEDKTRTTREAKQAASSPTSELESRTPGTTTINILGYEYTGVLNASTSSKDNLISNFIKELPTPRRENNDEQRGFRIRKSTTAQTSLGLPPSAPTHDEVTTNLPTNKEGGTEATLRENNNVRH